MSYDTWKANAPDPGSGSVDQAVTQRHLFWEGYRFAVRHRLVEAFISAHAGVKAFAALVRLANQCVCATCQAPVLPEEQLCPAHRQDAAKRSGEAA